MAANLTSQQRKERNAIVETWMGERIWTNPKTTFADLEHRIRRSNGRAYVYKYIVTTYGLSLGQAHCLIHQKVTDRRGLIASKERHVAIRKLRDKHISGWVVLRDEIPPWLFAVMPATIYSERILRRDGNQTEDCQAMNWAYGYWFICPNRVTLSMQMCERHASPRYGSVVFCRGIFDPDSFNPWQEQE